MDHFPTNWGRPVCFILSAVGPCSLLAQRNDAYDAYATFPVPHRPKNDTKDAFASAVQRTQ
jgi:20S proteasome subunit beta 7